MIQRELYMSRIRPFINSDLIKVLTGIHRSGKSVMLELIKKELLTGGVHAEQILFYNFENMRFMHLCTAQALHREIVDRTSGMKEGVYDSIRDSFPKYVVSMDELDFSRNGIKHRNIKDFLTMKQWD